MTSEAARTVFRNIPTPLQVRLRHRTDRYAPWEDGRVPAGPPCPAGMRTGPPDFVGVGVPKAGTTWWFRLIEDHPDVASPPEKEIGFFNRGFFRREQAGLLTDEDLASYHTFFPRPPGKKTGEWTPHYFFSYRLPPLLRRAAPGAKLLVLLRDPVERYKSDISRPMSVRSRRQVRYKSLARGLYTLELAPWEEVYGPEELLVLQYEACAADPAPYLAETYRFLGLDDGYRPPRLEALVNETRSKRTVSPRFEHLLVDLFEPDVVRLARRYPQIDLARWPNFRHLAGSGDGDG